MSQHSGDMTRDILAAVKRPYGLATAELPGYTVEQLGRMIQKLQAKGLIFRAKVGGKYGRYFDSAARAEEYAKTHFRRVAHRGDRQLRVDDSFDRARHVNAKAAELRLSNRCKLDAVIPHGLKTVELPNTLRDRFAVESAPPCFSSLRPGQYLDEQPKPWVQAAA